MDLQVNSGRDFELTGIGAGMIKTQGEVVVIIHNTPIHFQIVDDDFPLKSAGC